MCFFFNDTATTEIYTLSLHDALPISPRRGPRSRWTRSRRGCATATGGRASGRAACWRGGSRSEEHTSELQSRQYLVCRLLLEKKKEHRRSELHARFAIGAVGSHLQPP